jgi:hypothetical protein
MLHSISESSIPNPEIENHDAGDSPEDDPPGLPLAGSIFFGDVGLAVRAAWRVFRDHPIAIGTRDGLHVVVFGSPILHAVFPVIVVVVP